MKEKSVIVRLINNHGYKWYDRVNIKAKGYIFDNEGKLFQGNKLCEFFRGIGTLPDFINKLKETNGLFSVVIEHNKTVFAAVDRCRTFPLYYTKNGENLIITDNVEEIIQKKNNPHTDIRTEKTFLSLGFCHSRFTLIEGVFQIQSGEYIVFENGRLSSTFYHHFIPEFTGRFRENEIGLKAVIENIFSRTAKFLKGKTAVVPLSGGYDSRLIAVGLKSLGIENVICYTYGRKNNSEYEIAGKVAERLDYTWHNIEYNHELIADYLNSDDFKSYYPQAANYSSTFFMLEYFAVKYLKDNKLIPDNSVFLPGYTGDANAGSRLPIDIFRERTEQYMANRLCMKSCIMLKPSASVKKNIIDSMKEYWTITGSNSGIDNFYSWDLKERLSKYIINCAKTFSYFGYEYYFPLWDKEFVDYFSNIDKRHLYMKKLYNRTIQDHFFEAFRLNFNQELLPAEKVIKRQILKDKIKEYIPTGLKSKLIRNTNDDFIIEITKYMIDELQAEGVKVETYPKAKNSIIAQWYLHKIKQQLHEFDKS